MAGRNQSWAKRFQLTCKKKSFSGDKPFNCEICQKKFALSCNLRAHLKTHEAEYQNSAASLALYRRALAALGSQELTPSRGEESPGFDEELADEDEELDIEDHPSGDEEEEQQRPSSIGSNNNNSKSLADFGKAVTVTA
jgi:hypothetical protein